MNSISIIFIIFSVVFDTGVWYYVKDLKIFDDEEVHISLKAKKIQLTDRTDASEMEKLNQIETK